MVLDCKGKACPLPVVMSIRAMQELPQGEVLTVEVDNETAVENLTRMAQEKGYGLAVEQTSASEWHLNLTREGAAEKSAAAEEISSLVKSCGAPTGPTVVAVGTNEMGQGDPKLGAILMKSFLFSLTQLEDRELPQTMLFFNGGAKLTVEGSVSLEDLRGLEKRGVKIQTCGTCLDFYGIKEQLGVGSVTNMFSIAQQLLAAGKVVRI